MSLHQWQALQQKCVNKSKLNGRNTMCSQGKLDKLRDVFEILLFQHGANKVIEREHDWKSWVLKESSRICFELTRIERHNHASKLEALIAQLLQTKVSPEALVFLLSMAGGTNGSTFSTNVSLESSTDKEKLNSKTLSSPPGHQLFEQEPIPLECELTAKAMLQQVTQYPQGEKLCPVPRKLKPHKLRSAIHHKKLDLSIPPLGKTPPTLVCIKTEEPNSRMPPPLPPVTKKSLDTPHFFCKDPWNTENVLFFKPPSVVELKKATLNNLHDLWKLDDDNVQNEPLLNWEEVFDIQNNSLLKSDKFLYQKYLASQYAAGRLLELKHADVIQDMTYALTGLPSHLFQVDESNCRLTLRSTKDVVIRLENGGSKSLCSVLSDFAVAGTHFIRLRSLATYFVNDPSRGGLILKSFGHAIISFLTTHQAHVLQYNSTKQIQEIINISKRPRKLLEHLSNYFGCHYANTAWSDTNGSFEMVFKDFPRGVALLNYLHNVIKVSQVSATDYGLPFLSQWLLHHAASPFFDLLTKLIYKGRVEPWDDPYAEFLSPNLNDGALETLPSFFQNKIGENILSAGRLLGLLRLSSPNLYSCCTLMHDASDFKHYYTLTEPSCLHDRTSECLDAVNEYVVETIENSKKNQEQELMIVSRIREKERGRVANAQKKIKELQELERQKKKAQLSALNQQISESNALVQKQLQLDRDEEERKLAVVAQEEMLQKEVVARARELMIQKYGKMVDALEQRHSYHQWKLSQKDRMINSRASLRVLLANEMKSWTKEASYTKVLPTSTTDHLKMEESGEVEISLDNSSSRNNDNNNEIVAEDTKGQIKFSQKNIVQEPGGSSANMAGLLSYEESPCKKQEDDDDGKHHTSSSPALPELQEPSQLELEIKKEEKEIFQNAKVPEDTIKEETKDSLEVPETVTTSIVPHINSGGDDTLESSVKESLLLYESFLFRKPDVPSDRNIDPLDYTKLRNLRVHLNEHSSMIEQAALHFYIHEMKVLDVLKKLRDVVFTAKGACMSVFVQSIITGLSPENRTDWGSSKVLNAALDAAMFDCQITPEPYFDLMSYNNNESLSETLKTYVLEPSVLSVINGISLSFSSIKWPLTLVLDTEKLCIYSKIHAFFLQHRAITIVVQNGWKSRNFDGRLGDNATHLLQLFLHEQLYFLNSLGGYICNQVVDAPWKMFEEDLGRASTVYELKAAHDKYVMLSATRCFLIKNTTSSRIYDALTRAYKIMDKVRIKVSRAKLPTVEELVQEREGFQNTLRELHSLLTEEMDEKISMRAPHLQDLLLRLDFNNFYSR